MRTKEQQRLYSQTYKEKNREKILENKKKYYKENKEKINKYHREKYNRNKDIYTKQMREYYSKTENRAKKILWKAKETAKNKNLEFNIEICDIIIPEYCPFLGIRLTHELGKGQLQANSSIDRIDPKKGYIKGNVQIISRLANSMKSNATKEQLLTFAENIIKIYS